MLGSSPTGSTNLIGGSMNKVSSSSSTGIGFAGLLTVVFIALKLLGKITWSWWWVLSPLWISTGIGIVVFLFFLGIFAYLMRDE